MIFPALRDTHMHMLITVNAAWNIWNFRQRLVATLLTDGHRVTILAPADASVPDLERLGCQFVDLDMNAKGLGPLQNLRLMLRFRQHFTALRPDVILSYTVKNNIFGAIAARPLRIPFLPNVTGLGTAFLSGGPLQALAVLLYRHSFRPLKVIFFQNSDDLQLFLNRRIVHSAQARLLPGSGIDLKRFETAEFSPLPDQPVFLMIARLLRDKGVLEFVEAARKVKAQIPGARFSFWVPPGLRAAQPLMPGP
uniref:glycosyltransferase n=1 Tax=Pararhizobium sp. IMCC3301 TaxID=3067904 RepID=UPI002741252B|nr:glycosyltransferase [Pararhizobium sp. IMCC3301]